MYSDEMTWDTADVKPCPHGYVFLDQCEVCKSQKEKGIPILDDSINGTDG